MFLFYVIPKLVPPFKYYFSNERLFWEKEGLLIQRMCSLNLSGQNGGALSVIGALSSKYINWNSNYWTAFYMAKEGGLLMKKRVTQSMRIWFYLKTQMLVLRRWLADSDNCYIVTVDKPTASLWKIDIKWRN